MDRKEVWLAVALVLAVFILGRYFTDTAVSNLILLVFFLLIAYMVFKDKGGWGRLVAFAGGGHAARIVGNRQVVIGLAVAVSLVAGGAFLVPRLKSGISPTSLINVVGGSSAFTGNQKPSQVVPAASYVLASKPQSPVNVTSCSCQWGNKVVGATIYAQVGDEIVYSKFQNLYREFTLTSQSKQWQGVTLCKAQQSGVYPIWVLCQ